MAGRAVSIGAALGRHSAARSFGPGGAANWGGELYDDVLDDEGGGAANLFHGRCREGA